MAVGNLSREIRAKYCIHEIKNILYSYICCNENISSEYIYIMVKNHRITKNTISTNTLPTHILAPTKYYTKTHIFQINITIWALALGNHTKTPPNTSSSNFCSNIFNPSGQFRNAHQDPKPMDIDNISNRGTIEEINNIETVFLN